MLYPLSADCSSRRHRWSDSWSPASTPCAASAVSKAYARAHADGRERTWPEGLRRSPPAARSNHLDPASRGVAAAQRLCASRHSKPEAALPCDGRVGASLEEQGDEPRQAAARGDHERRAAPVAAWPRIGVAAALTQQVGRAQRQIRLARASRLAHLPHHSGEACSPRCTEPSNHTHPRASMSSVAL